MPKPAASPLTSLVVLVLCLSSFGTCLVCYQCAATSDDGKCLDAKQLLSIPKADTDLFKINGSLVIGNSFFKRCPDVHTKCMIESFKTGGRTLSYNRDCTDGVTAFSYNSDEKDYRRLKHLPETNKSVCAYSQKANVVVCVQVCTEDLCNGPQLTQERKDQVEEESEEVICEYEKNVYGYYREICSSSPEVAVHAALLITSLYVVHAVQSLSS